MAKFVCKNCNYEFEDNLEKCGFCGMDCLEEVKDAKELLEDVERLLG